MLKSALSAGLRQALATCGALVGSAIAGLAFNLSGKNYILTFALSAIPAAFALLITTAVSDLNSSGGHLTPIHCKGRAWCLQSDQHACHATTSCIYMHAISGQPIDAIDVAARQHPFAFQRHLVVSVKLPDASLPRFCILSLLSLCSSLDKLCIRLAQMMYMHVQQYNRLSDGCSKLAENSHAPVPCREMHVLVHSSVVKCTFAGIWQQIRSSC